VHGREANCVPQEIRKPVGLQIIKDRADNEADSLGAQGELHRGEKREGIVDLADVDLTRS
jgi:hypothetical protein